MNDESTAQPTGGTVIVENIGQLLTLGEPGEGPLGVVADASLLIIDGTVVFSGPAADFPHDLLEDPLIVDAEGALVTPGLVDPHTHLLFAGSRAHEFNMRASGATYQQIQAAGGGILSTVRATRAATDDGLLATAGERLAQFVANGTTALEVKTGYALDLDGEKRLLSLYAQLQEEHFVRMFPTLLAHVPPPDMGREEFLRRFCEEVIPFAKAESLAHAVDVYCDVGAFSLDETRTILRAAKAQGLGLRVHAEQFTHTGAAELAAELGALSVEHLEELSAGAPALLAKAGVVCNLLPGAALTLKLKWPSARRLIDEGCIVALGTDCNPGSSLTESQPLMMSLAVTQMGMTCEEAWLGCTRHAARAIAQTRLGHLTKGAAGDFVIWDAKHYESVVQHLGASLAEHVFIDGNPVFDKD